MQFKSVFRKAAALAAAFAVIASASASPVRAQRTVVTWFVGLGTGTNAAQIDAQNALVERFNASQDQIELKINLAASNAVANDALATQINAGQAPDIVGPVGFSGANSFPGAWLDLQPLVDKVGYDLKQFPESLTAQYQSADGLIGIPFAVFPSVIYYNTELFDEAGLAYPPKAYGEKYVAADGTEKDWSWETLTELAMQLTVDANGNDANSPDFDGAKIEQYGFVEQWSLARSEFSTWGGAEFYDASTGKVTIPENWRAKAKWLHDGVWTKRFIPNSTAENSDLLKPTVFASGKTGMGRTQLWYTCCLGDLKANWDIAPMPTYNGNIYTLVDADTFRITKASKNQDAAFTVLQYLLGEGALDLLKVYAGFPARPDLQDTFIASLEESFGDKNWNVITEGLQYAVSPNHESDFPNYAKGMQRFSDFRTLLYGDTGKDIDVDAELDKLTADLETIIAEVK